MEVRVFNTVLGIPAHPLIIHVAVIFIPLLVLGAIVYAAWPPFHSKITWAVLAVAIIAPLAGLAAKLSGQDLKHQLVARGTSQQLLALIAQHNSYGNKTFWWTVGLAVLTLVLLAYNWRASRAVSVDADANAGAGGAIATPLRVGSTVVMLVVGAILGYYVFKTGDTGAHMVWGTA
jgi:hypothetical protein